MGRAASQTRQLGQLDGTYVTFLVGDHTYGLPRADVTEILGFTFVLPLPGAPPYLRGTIARRGVTIPVVDLRPTFGMGPAPETPHTCIVVASVGVARFGIIVDDLGEIVDFAGHEITPVGHDSVAPEFVLGTGRAGDRVTKILDLEQILSLEEIARFAGLDRAPESPARE